MGNYPTLKWILAIMGKVGWEHLASSEVYLLVNLFEKPVSTAIRCIYGIVRMCMPISPLFQRCQVYDWPPFFNKKYMNDPIFLDSYVKGPIFLTTWYTCIHIFFTQRFFEAACSLGIQ